MSQHSVHATFCFCCFVLGNLAQSAFAAVLFSDNFNADTSGTWTQNKAPVVGPFTADRQQAQFAFDYSTFGIPPAPGSADTLGLRLRANLPLVNGVEVTSRPGGVASGLSLSPTAKNFGTDYKMTVYAWSNFIGAATLDGLADTLNSEGGTNNVMFAVGTSGTVPLVVADTGLVPQGQMDGIGFATSNDGAMSQDYRVYPKSGTIASAASGVYAAGSTQSIDPFYTTRFPSLAAPAIQQTLSAAEYPDPFNTQFAFTPLGSFGFSWHKVEITKLNNSVTWDIDGTTIATINVSALALGGNNIALGVSDPYDSTTRHPSLVFTVFDDLVVTSIPEPSTLILLVGCAATCCGWISLRRLCAETHWWKPSPTPTSRSTPSPEFTTCTYHATLIRRLLYTLGATIALSAPSTSTASIVFGPDFNSYTSSNLGSPSGLPTPAGGLTLLNGDSNTLLIGGNANTPAGGIYSVGLVRDIDQHITGFASPASLYKTAPYIDGGLAYGPSNVLFFTRYNLHELGQIKPGSGSPNRVDPITGFGAPGNSVGSLAFVPLGFGSPGALKIVTFQQGQFGTLPLTPDGAGTYNLGAAALDVTLTGGPEGIAYVAAGNPGFTSNSILVAEYNNGTIAAYDIDANANPIPATRRVFLTGLTGAEGAYIDPLTGDFLFSTFMAGSEVFVIHGFAAPIIPEPSSFLTGCVALIGTVAISGRRYLSRTKRSDVG